MVVIEGPDASGKTTIIQSLMALSGTTKLPGEWMTFKYPNRNTAIGSKINDILSGKLVVSKEVEMKFFADNRAEDRIRVEQAIASGVNVIIDRYVYSSIAYTLASQYEDTMDTMHAPPQSQQQHSQQYSTAKIVRFDRGLLKPDIAILIHGDHRWRRGNDVEVKDGYNREVLMSNFMNAFNALSTPWALIDNSEPVHGSIKTNQQGNEESCLYQMPSVLLIAVNLKMIMSREKKPLQRI
jgi:thymidylate kinase